MAAGRMQRHQGCVSHGVSCVHVPAGKEQLLAELDKLLVDTRQQLVAVEHELQALPAA